MMLEKKSTKLRKQTISVEGWKSPKEVLGHATSLIAVKVDHLVAFTSKEVVLEPEGLPGIGLFSWNGTSTGASRI